jgi:hypothetical protein
MRRGRDLRKNNRQDAKSAKKDRQERFFVFFSGSFLALLASWRLFCVASLIFVCACRQEQAKIYTGPTESLDEIVAKINQNNSQIPTLWAHQDFEGSIVDDKHNAHAVSAHGVILYRAPDELRIVANSDFEQPVFELGTTADYYWLKVNPELDTLWWGIQNVGNPRASEQIPIRPDLILDVLGIGVMDTHLMVEPFPVLRFNNDADAYMVDSIVHETDRLVVRKEIWYDRATLEPRLVLLFDNNGRVVLRAHLSEFAAVAGDGGARMATRYSLLFPDTGSTMQFVFSDQALNKNGIPHDGSIHLPDLANPGVKNVVQVDKDSD